MLWYSGLVLFYLRSSIIISICPDIEQNPGPSFVEGYFNFAHWNLNSLPAHNYARISQLKAYVSQHNLHILALSETALKSSNKSEDIRIDGYTVIRRDLPENTTHGGVLIFHKDDLAVRRRHDLENHPNILVTEVNICNKKLFFTVVYRRFCQTPEQFQDFKSKFDELCSAIKLETPFGTVFCGDFNAHLSDWWDGDGDDNFGTTLQNIFSVHGLQQIVNQPTYNK